MTPRWSTSCGEDGVVAFENQTPLVRPCQPLVDADSSTTTIRVAASDVLGADPCSVASSFDLEVRAGGLPSQSAIGCDEPPRLLDSAAGRTHQFYAFATGLDGIARGTSCAATALAGESVPLACQPLSSQGAAAVSLVGLQGVSGPACPEGHAFDVLLDGAAVNAAPIACSATAHIAPLEPGTTTLVAQVYQPGGALFGTPLSCLVEVRPGDNSVAACGL
jgi:hypothetical protein